MLVLCVAGCAEEPQTGGLGKNDARPSTDDVATDRARPAADDSATGAADPPVLTWSIDTVAAGDRFRPRGFSDPVTAWGIERGRLARLALGSDSLTRTGEEAWDASAAPGLVSWRNGQGAWLRRTGGDVEHLAGSEPRGAYDGPPDVLLAPDGSTALLSWHAEWSLHHELRAADGALRALDVSAPGYMAMSAALFLDGTRVLFTGIANAPRGGAPEYRESGWRGDLFELDLRRRAPRRVTDVADGTFLRPAGWFRGRVLVAEHAPGGVVTSWLYHPVRWTREPIVLPRGRAHGHEALISVHADGAAADAPELLLIATDTLRLGIAADPDALPAATTDGRTLLARVRTPAGVRLLLVRGS